MTNSLKQRSISMTLLVITCNHFTLWTIMSITLSWQLARLYVCLLEPKLLPSFLCITICLTLLSFSFHSISIWLSHMQDSGVNVCCCRVLWHVVIDGGSDLMWSHTCCSRNCPRIVPASCGKWTCSSVSVFTSFHLSLVTVKKQSGSAIFAVKQNNWSWTLYQS